MVKVRPTAECSILSCLTLLNFSPLEKLLRLELGAEPMACVAAHQQNPPNVPEHCRGSDTKHLVHITAGG